MDNAEQISWKKLLYLSFLLLLHNQQCRLTLIHCYTLFQLVYLTIYFIWSCVYINGTLNKSFFRIRINNAVDCFRIAKDKILNSYPKTVQIEQQILGSRLNSLI